MVLLKDLVDEAKKKYKYGRKVEKEKRKKEVKRKKGKFTSRTGFYNLIRISCPECTQGYIWVYSHEGNRISRVNFMELKSIILSNGWRWEIEDRNEAFYTSKLVGYPLYDLIKNEVY